MTQYHEQTWGQRLNVLGDIAEGVFEQVAPLGKYERFGFNRPPFKLTKVSAFLRHTPDYVTGTGHLVEVMGCGRDGVVKLKPDKYDALKDWNKYAPVALFLWNSSTEEWSLVQWDGLKRLVSKARREIGIQAFDDGNEYLAIPWVWLDTVMPYAT